LAEQQIRFEAAWERLQSAYPNQAKKMQRRINEVVPRSHLREAARSEYVRDRWIVRTFGVQAGELTSLGDDIFYLTLQEVLNLLAGDRSAMEYIPARKATHSRYSALPPYPSVIRGCFDPIQWAAEENRRSDFYDSSSPVEVIDTCKDRGRLITGAAGSAGTVAGSVRLLDSAEQGEFLQQGEILVTTQTDIAWTLLFPRAAAIVTDVGAPLSHAAIVARELGIPAVVGCGDATMRLKTGDRVRVDGGHGIVEIL
ncbi:MAG: PEP-utilizing enzyme, partial [Anaerolineales bacterium]|nr:PEP-utilizing enzyme [Anaerolineales bacterium]